MGYRTSLRTIFRVCFILLVGWAAGYFFGTMLPTPGYISHLRWMPLHTNTPTDVSDYVQPFLPDDPYDAFEFVAGTSSKVSAFYDQDCECSYVSFWRFVTRLPLPDRELNITFKMVNGKPEFDEAYVVIWFL